MRFEKEIGKCVFCGTNLSTKDIIHMGCISFFDRDGHLSSCSSGSNIIRCPKCFKTEKSDIIIKVFNNKLRFLTHNERKEAIKANQIHKRFFHLIIIKVVK